MIRPILAASALFICAPFSPAAEPPADVAKLSEQLAASDRDTRREAGYRLEKLGPAAKAALPALIRAIALRATVKSQPGTAPLTVLTEALHDSQASVRRTAAELLGQIGDQEPDKITPALGTLVAMLANSEDQAFTLEALRAAHVRDPAAIEQALAIKSSEARAWACERAAKLGKKGRPLVEKLTPLLSDGNDYVRRAARKAIDQLNR